MTDELKIIDSLKICNYYSFNYNGFSMKPHSHDAFEIMYNGGGSCEITIFSASAKEKLNLKKGQVIFINSSVMHTLYVKNQTSCKIMNLEVQLDSSQQAFIDAFESFPFFKSLFSADYFVIDDAMDINRQISHIHRLLTCAADIKTLPETKLAVFAALLNLLITIASERKSALSYCVSKVLSAEKYILAEYASPITVSGVAAHVKLSPVYLERIFKSANSVTLTDYINNLRIAKAKTLLENANLNITDIAFSCGFNSRQSFYFNFQRRLSCSPKEYRDNFKKQLRLKSRQSKYETP